MKENQKIYWKGVEQLTNDPEFVKHADKEFPEALPLENEEASGSSRRDFLKLMGFGVAAASLAACETPIKNAIPYLNKPVDINPSIPNYYASTYINGGDYASIVVKTREGRPIKIDGNKLSPITQGGTNAQVEASVLSLYDKERLTNPYIGGKGASWEELDKQVIAKLKSIALTGGAIRIVSNTVLSPTTKEAIKNFTSKYPNAVHVAYDPTSSNGMVQANDWAFGKAVIPSYHFDNAKVIVGFGADFLGTWISPIEFTKQYGKTRKISKEKPEMSRHFQFESNFSLTGANADYRTPIKPSQEGLVIANLYNLLAAKAGAATMSVAKLDVPFLTKAANELWANPGAGLVVASSNDPYVQVVVNAINSLIGSYSKTINLSAPVNFRQGNDAAMTQFIADAKAGRVAAAIFFNANPVYNHANGADLADAISKIGLTVSTSDRMDETTSLVQFVAPDHHFLESWNDANPKEGHYSLAQPTITPLFDTRHAGESFLTWAEDSSSYYDFLRANWKANYFTKQSETGDFNMFWDKALFDGVFTTATPAAESVSFGGNLPVCASQIGKTYKADSKDVEIVLYEKIGLGNGSQANNPWLQEMSDPITKATWDNYFTVSQKWANENGIKMVEGETTVIKVTVNGKTLEGPALVQPGQAYGTIGLAVGYGRTKAGKVANGVGMNAFPLVAVANGFANYSITSGVNVELTSTKYRIAQTQTHQTYMGRTNVVQESVLAKYKEDASAGREHPEIYTSEGFKKPSKISLWKGHQYSQHHWGLAIDMNSCVGCGACTIACQVENNVAVVGRDEVLNRREMAWIRIDRYYSSDAPAGDLTAMEVAAENPEVTFQPMMCQHCNNAPCETVCPVAATTHSSEGLNQMTYNRCIGTRYCANNCPYKVRRFNWFKYHDNKQFDTNLSMNNDLGKMVLNPDVTVRARGVMEKCTMCVQRIQAGKLTAKREARPMKDGDVDVACATACPSDAIVFGDMNDPNSRITKMLQLKEEGEEKVVNEERAYHVLEEINVAPNVWYFTKIRNKDVENKA
ncbi:TAT-variant-translocated molybdopterin oxidoreductase [Penaeicola halotolerans]|uniref:TAT-variant-translocated molybdopterin oxidoreductase n=1 Tax=Penaeicola halotolerans TaxID=2793196 RepID=UPI001CF8081A|nr:TAT-variant-translocated molybdopterin oxidoreductase [Penaeicola halotolerans]